MVSSQLCSKLQCPTLNEHQKDIRTFLSTPSYQNIHQSVFLVEFFWQTVLIWLLFVFWIHFRCRLGSEVRRGRMTGLEGRRTSLFLLHSLHASSCPCRCVQLQWPPPLLLAGPSAYYREDTDSSGQRLRTLQKGCCAHISPLCVCTAGPCYASFC